MVSEPPFEEDKIKEAIPRLEEVLSKLSGKRVKISRKEGSDFATFLTQMSQAINNTLAQNENQLSEEEKKAKVSEFMKEFFKIVGLDSVANPIDYAMNELFKPFADPEKGTYLEQTKFGIYRDAVFKIAAEIVMKNKHNEVNAIFSNIPDEDGYAMFQNAIRLNDKVLPYLEKNHEKIEKRTVERYVEIYKDLATHMEKLALQLFAMKEVLSGNKPDYSKLKDIKLAQYVESLSRIPNFVEVMKPVDPNIRNAIAHGSVVFDPIRKTVNFVDKRKTISLDYDSFIKLTHELAAAVRAVSHIENAMNIIKLQIVKTQFSL